MSGNNPSATAEPALPPKKPCPNLRYVSYGTEKESPFLPAIRQLISNDLSEPYSIYVYRYFLYQWGQLCFMVSEWSRAGSPSHQQNANADLKALDEEENLIGVIVCKLEPHRGGPMRGYIAMLATRKDYRGHGIATSLVKMATEKMISEDADEVRHPKQSCIEHHSHSCFLRSLSKPKSTTSPLYGSTRTWASFVPSACIDTTSTGIRRSD
jgi:peptide alpha-N-acetyltransferase